MQPSFVVFQDQATREFRVSRQLCNSAGLNCLTGKLLTFTEEEMREHGCDFAREHFSKFLRERFEIPSDLAKMTKEQQAAFYRSHKIVFVYLVDNHKVELAPFKYMERDGRGAPIELSADQRVAIEWPANNEEFFAALKEALGDIE